MMIPSTEEMRNVYASVQALGIRSGPPGAIEYNHGKAKFDAWLAAIEREAAARALEDAASWMQDGVGEAYNPSETDYAQQKREAKARRAWLRARAAEYRKAVQ